MNPQRCASTRAAVAAAALSALTLTSTSAVAQPDPPSRVVVFGASYTDAGNVLELTGDWPPSPPYDDGRFCDGPLWYEAAGAELDWPPASPSLLGGDVYSYGGAMTGWDNTFVPCFPDDPIPPIGLQIQAFLDSNDIVETDLFIIGANNDLNYLILDLDGGREPGAAVANMVSHVETLATAGAENLIVSNMLPLDRAPFITRTGLSDFARQVTDEYNALLEAAMQDAAASLDIDIQLFDMHGVISNVLDDPSAYGFTNTTDPALQGVDICTVIDGDPVDNPDEYVWWDFSHATHAVHAIMGDALLDLLDCPSDLNGDRVVGLDDLSILLGNFGQPGGPDDGDLDGDGEITLADLSILLGAFGTEC